MAGRMRPWRGIIEEYRKFLPVTEKTPVVTLGEGNTPLIQAKLGVWVIDIHVGNRHLELLVDARAQTRRFDDRADLKNIARHAFNPEAAYGLVPNRQRASMAS